MGETTVLLADLIVIRVHLVATVMIALVGLIVMLLVEHRVVIVMTDHVRLIVTLVLLAALIVTRVHLAATVMIVLVGLTVMLLVERRVVIVMTGLVLAFRVQFQHLNLRPPRRTRARAP